MELILRDENGRSLVLLGWAIHYSSDGFIRLSDAHGDERITIPWPREQFSSQVLDQIASELPEGERKWIAPLLSTR